VSLDIVRAAALEGVPHGFFGRRGGLSTGTVAGLNCGTGSGDDPKIVEANRRLAADAILPQAPIASVYQVHSPTAVIVYEAVPHAERPQADALVTGRPGLLLGVVTADCAPILMADQNAGVIAAVHAGWRGASAGVTDQAIAAMLSIGAKIEHIAAAIGPCLAKASFEVDPDFVDCLMINDPENEQFFGEGLRGKMHFDLEAYLVARLATAGIQRIEAVGLDTYAHQDRFYSYRRSTHRGEPTYGRQLSLIGLAR
jgi:YfiH family protein